MRTIDDAESGQGGVASVQWSLGGSNFTRLGDADFARDALAGQGIANGISSALRAIDDTGPSDRPPPIDDRIRHLHALRELAIGCRYAESPFWDSYRKFLSIHRGVAASEVDPPEVDAQRADRHSGRPIEAFPA